MLHHRLSGVTLQQLRIFAAIARESSLARAAASLALSAPTVSEQLKTLERVVGVTLVDRSRGRRTLELTEAGRVLLRACEGAFADLESGLRDIEGLRDTDGGSVAFGAAGTFGTHVLPVLYQSFQRLHPEITVHVELGRRQLTLEALRERRIALAVLPGPIDDPDLDKDLLAEVEIVLIGPRGHRLAGPEPAPFQELASEHLILAERPSPPSDIVHQLAERTGTRLQVIWEVAQTDAQIQAVARGLGIAPVATPALAFSTAAADVTVLSVQGFPVNTNWYVAAPIGPLSPAAQLFREHLLARRAELVELLRKHA